MTALPDIGVDTAAGRCESARLAVDAITLAYGSQVVSRELSLEIPHGALTAVVGANACGKSTLLRSMVRLVTPTTGAVRFDGRDISTMGAKEYARLVSFLPQESQAPEGLTVERLVCRGRFPHQSLLPWWSAQDEQAVTHAMAVAGVADLADQPVNQLSGGQRQRVWIAMVLAQEAPYLLLDEPTTFLDIRHQHDLLRLLADLRDQGRTVVAVLHDINQACRFADHLIAMAQGRVVAAGPPSQVVTEELMEQVFDLPSLVVEDPLTGTPLVVPRP